MRSTLKTMALAGVLALGGLAMIHVPAYAGCGGGGYRSTGGYGGGHSFNAGYNGARGGGGCGGCGVAGMSMPGMNMGGYASVPQAAPIYTPVAYPQAAPSRPPPAPSTPARCTRRSPARLRGAARIAAWRSRDVDRENRPLPGTESGELSQPLIGQDQIHADDSL